MFKMDQEIPNKLHEERLPYMLILGFNEIHTMRRGRPFWPKVFPTILGKMALSKINSLASNTSSLQRKYIGEVTNKPCFLFPCFKHFVN
jgi:hypothetical protein